MEIDEEVLVGFDLQKRIRSFNTHILIDNGEKPIITAQVNGENGENPIITTEDNSENGEKPVIRSEDSSENGEKPIITGEEYYENGENPIITAQDKVENGEKYIITVEGNSENGGKPTIIVEDKSENGEKKESNNGDNDMGENENMLYPSKHQGTNDYSADQNGADVAVPSPESNSGDEEVHATTNGTAFMNGTNTTIGLKHIETLLNESSSTTNGKLADVTATELNKVNEILKSEVNELGSETNMTIGLKHAESWLDESPSSINGKLADVTTTELNKVNEILKSGVNELGSEPAEYDVEGVIAKQETHDFYCPNCNSCITKRVILRRRKRKIQEISTGDEIISSVSGQTPAVTSEDDGRIVEGSAEEGNSKNKEAVDALTCFSCFSIFIPTGKGFLFWRSASKPIIVNQQEPSLDTSDQARPSLSTDAATGNASQDEEPVKSFPMWILTCCEPYPPKRERERERETAQQRKSDIQTPSDPEPPVTPEHDDEPELPATPPVDTSDPHPTETSSDAKEGKAFPSWWIVTLCQPSRSQTKPEETGKTDNPAPLDTKLPMTPSLGSSHPQPVDVYKPEIPTTPSVNSSDLHPMDDYKSKLPTTPSANSSDLCPIDDYKPELPTTPSFNSSNLRPIDDYKPELPTAPSVNSSDLRPIDDYKPELPTTPSVNSSNLRPIDDYKPELPTTPSVNSSNLRPIDDYKPELPMIPSVNSSNLRPINDYKPELPTTPSVNNSNIRPIDGGCPTETPVDATEDEGGKTFSSWILNCCQSSKNQNMPDHIGKIDTPVSSTESPGTHDADTSVQQPKHDADTTSPRDPSSDITPGGDTLSSSQIEPALTHDSERSFSSWFLTCCQPDHKVNLTEKPDKGSPPDAKPDIAPDADKLLSSGSDPNVPGTPEADSASPSDSKSDIISTDKDTLSSPDPKLPMTPNAVSDFDAQNQPPLPIPGQQNSHKFTVIPPDVAEPGPKVKVNLIVTPGEDSHPNLIDNRHDTPHISGPDHDVEAQTEPLLPSNERPRRGISGLDFIKAIVYGGLLETIASLSIISSAAGGDATTLNIVALGLANVFGGLIVLLHNLRDLKNNRPQYEEQLGKPGHFLLHATIAIISYLIFGLMAPIVYGFSFRKSDDKNKKLITLAAASLLCIILLSIGKAYARRSSAKDYFKTVLYYASIGVSVSGLGYVSGQLINDGLKELGVFDSRSPVNMSVLETGALNAALSSY